MSGDRRLWSNEEDQQIVRLVSRYGTKKWPIISEKLCAQTQYERTGKQCRQRWYNHLNPEINNSFWSPQDEKKLFDAHKIHGNKWKSISRLFVGRTDNSIKNHFYSTIRRCLRRINKLQGEKNSTLKMRNIKPYVLSKILADKNLTDSILQIGKIKPNKNKKDLSSEYFKDFDRMIEKLYQINQQYEQYKAEKKSSVSQSKDSLRSLKDPIKDESQLNPSDSFESKEEQVSPSSVVINQKDFQEQIKDEIMAPQSSNSPKKINRKIKKKIISPPASTQQILFKQSFGLRNGEFSSGKRQRKPINYMKLNEGILCESQRPEVDQTNYESQFSKKRVDLSNYDPFMTEGKQVRENLEQIVQQEQKSYEKDNLNIFNHDFVDHRPMGFGSFNISNPSPSFARNSSHFDDLIIIGTHLRLINQSQAQQREQSQYECERKKSEQQFIEEILEINFDPNDALVSLQDDINNNE